MGFDIDRFSGAVDEDFKCSICLGVLEGPLATPCGHVFCSNCVLPWVVQNGSCPLKCEKFSTKELNSVLPLRNLILKLEIRCDNFRRGCPEEVKIQMLAQHLEDCDFAPVKCSNKGCQEVVNIKDQAHHETQACEYRPVGRCEQGCGLVLQFSTRAEHDCLKALHNHSSCLQSKIKNQEHNLKKNSLRYGKREKALLAQVACLQNEIQMQALRYQKKLNESKAEMEYISAVASFEKPWENTETLGVQLARQDGSLGFNIIGGSGGEGGISEGIIVSRVNEKGPANRSQLHVHDRIMEVNGKDLSKATHEEAVEAFKNAQEPIIVQVMRRSPCNAKNGGTTPGGGGPGVGPGGIPGPVPVERSAVCSVGTQTELQSEDLLWKVLQRCSLPPSEKHCDGTLEGLCELDAEDPLSVLDSDLLQKLEAMEGNLDLPILDEEDCLDRAYEMEYEDIVLKRTNVEDKLGLTLCYGSEEDSGIFISEIDPNSIAYDDARLKEGDQILQINGEDVLNKDQALSLFSLQMECTSLLVCRPQLRFEDCLYEGNALLDDLQMDMLEQTHQEAMQFTACLLHNSEGRPDEDATTDTGTTNTSNHLEKDSGVGRATDESTRNDESSDHELLVDDGSSVHQKFAVDTASMGSGGDLRYSNESFTSNSTAEHDFMGQEISVEECRKFQVALENKCDNKHLRSDTDESTRGKETKVMRLGSDSMDTTSQSGDSLNRPCRNRLICDHDELEKEKRINGHDIWLSNHSQDDQLDTIPCQCPGSGSQKVDKPEKDTSHDRPAELSIDGKQEANKENGVPGERLHRRSGSGSGRSHRAPRTVPGSPGGRSKSSSSSRDRSKSTSSSGSTKGSSKDRKNSPCKTAPVNTAEHDQQQAHHQQQQQQQQYHQDQLGQLPGATPYPRRPATNPHLRSQISQRSPYFMQHDTTRTNLLKHNWKVQQQTTQLRKSFDRYGSIQSLQSVPAYAKHYRSYLHLVNQNEENAMKNTSNARKNVEGQWKVKIRSDGTRYITKRSSRDRLLKERATKIQEERAGMTTDDEAISEMKLGRYWSKEDRKEHLARARDQRLRREYMQQARMECLQELEEDGILSGGGGKREPDIVELSHRKLLKKKGRKMMLDDFTTVQEMLIHGSKVSPDTAKEFSPFLNVTMV